MLPTEDVLVEGVDLLAALSLLRRAGRQRHALVRHLLPPHRFRRRLPRLLAALAELLKRRQVRQLLHIMADPRYRLDRFPHGTEVRERFLVGR